MLTQVEIKEDVIKLIADSAVKKGITLLGGIAGVGKTVTASAVIDYIKDNDLFIPEHIFYINTFAEKEAGVDIKVAMQDLAAKRPSTRMLVVLDEIRYRNSVEIAIWLAQQGHSVLGVAQTHPDTASTVTEGSGLSGIIVNTVTWIKESDRDLVIGEVLNELNALVLQDSLAPTHHRALVLTPETKHQLIDTLNTGSLYKLYLAIDALKVKEE